MADKKFSELTVLADKPDANDVIAILDDTASEVRQITRANFLSLGIDDDDVLEVDGTPNSGEYARFTANGIEGRTEAEFKGDFNLEIGTDVQAYDAGLTDLAGVAMDANKFYYTSADNTHVAGDVTAFARSILDDADEATFKATVNLEIGTDVLAEQTIGIADDNLLEVDGDPNNGEYAKFTANGLEGKTFAEMMSDLFSETRYKTRYIDAASMLPCTTNGAEAGTHEFGTNDIDIDYYAFDSGATEERVQFKMPMPEDWDRGTIKAKFFWGSATGSTAGDTVEWRLKGQAASNDDAIDQAFGDAGEVISDVLLADNGADMQVTGATPAITIGGTPALGDMIIFEVSRNTDGTDDMAEDAWLFGVWIQYQTSGVPTAW